MIVRTISYLDDNAPKKLTKSLVNTGFSVLRDHPIPLSLIEDVYKQWKKFYFHHFTIIPSIDRYDASIGVGIIIISSERSRVKSDVSKTAQHSSTTSMINLTNIEVSSQTYEHR